MSEHKKWADLYSIISIMLVISLTMMASTIADLANADGDTRIDLVILVNAIVIVVSIWQAAGVLLGRLQRLERNHQI